MGDLLQPVGNGPDYYIAAQPWRIGPKEPPPFQTQVCDTEFRQDNEAILQLAPAGRRAPRGSTLNVSAIRRLLGVVIVEAAGTGGLSFQVSGRICLRPPRQAPARSHRDYEAKATMDRAR
jgi:hypothetical protein